MSSPANKMEEKKKPKTRKFAETNSSSWSNVFWLSAFLLLEAAALISVVTWQQHALDELTTHIDTETRVSRELDRACQNSHDNWDGGPPHQNEVSHRVKTNVWRWPPRWSVLSASSRTSLACLQLNDYIYFHFISKASDAVVFVFKSTAQIS